MPRPVAVKRPAHTQGSERRNMPKHVGSDPPPDARGAPLHPPGASFARETPGPRSRGRHCIDTGPQIANFLENKNRPHWPWVCNRRPPSARRSLVHCM